MSSWTKKTHHVRGPIYKGQHRFEHWYRDNQSLISRPANGTAFQPLPPRKAKAVLWDRFDFYTKEFLFTPWVTSLIPNHYHCLGYCKVGKNLGIMMQRIHGSVAKLVNELAAQCRPLFWGDGGSEDYFDGGIRDEKQCRLAYR